MSAVNDYRTATRLAAELEAELAEARKWLAADEPWIQVQEAKAELAALRAQVREMDESAHQQAERSVAELAVLRAENERLKKNWQTQKAAADVMQLDCARIAEAKLAQETT